MPSRFRHLIVLFLLAAALPARADAPYAPGQVIVKYRAAVSRARRAGIQSRFQASLERHFAAIDVDVLALPAGVSVDSAIAAYRGDPDVEYAEPNYRLEPTIAPDDSLFGQQWALRNTGQTGGVAGADIEATRAWDLFTGDPNLKIGVIDSGVDYTHPDLAPNIWTNPGEIPGNRVDDDGNGYVDDVHGYDFANNDSDPMDDLGHGTHVAGTIAARSNNHIGVSGICWRAQIVCIKFLGPGGGFASGAIAAIEYALATGIKLTNNSWGGGGDSQALRDEIAAAGSAGMLFVASAGNTGLNDDVSPTFPSSYDLANIVSVAATNSSDQLSGFSSYGAVSVDLGAPGESILSTLFGGGYVLASGTSMAAPHVTGALALLWGRHPDWTAEQIKARLLSSVDPLSALAGKTVSGGRLNMLFAGGNSDAIPPSAVTDLGASLPTSNSLTLDWHAPGDDGPAGTAEQYDLRYSTAPITLGNFAAAARLTAPSPLPSGQAQTIEVTGLSIGTTYYFALRALDELANAGPLSNPAFGTTLGAPIATVSPGSLEAALLTGAQTSRTLELRNDGEGTLDFQLEAEALAPAIAAAPFLPSPTLAKGRMNPMAAQATAGSHGGPDHAGYRWVDSDAADGPAFSWVELSATGTPIELSGDDETSEPIPIGFSFHYYDGVFNSLRVCTNGWISFTSAANAYFYQVLPNGGAPGNLLAPCWTDLVIAPQSIFQRQEPGRMILEFKDAHTYAGEGPFTFEVILYIDGRIGFQYLSVPAVARYSTVGFQNAVPNDGLTIAFNAPYLRSGLAVQIEPPHSWLSAEPRSGRILAGQSRSIAVTIDASGQFGGTYDDVLRIHSNDPLHSQLLVPVQLEVTGVPDIGVDRTSLAFGPLLIGASATDSMTVTNIGTQPLSVTGIEASNPEVSVTPTAFTLGVFESRRVFATYSPMTSGVPGQLTVRSDDPDQPVRTIALTGLGAPAPAAGAAPPTFSPTVASGLVQTSVLHVTNGGEGPLFYRVKVVPAGSDWLHVIPDTGQVAPHASLDLAVEFDARNRLGGTYDASLAVTTNDPLRPALTAIPVHMTVTGVPDIQLAPTSISFGAVFVTQSMTDSVQVLNRGTGVLTTGGVVASPGFTVDAGGFSLAPGASRSIRVSFVPTAAGATHGTLTVNSDDPDQPAAVVALNGQGLPGPDLAVTPDSLLAVLAPLATQTRSLTLSNSLAQAVNWTLAISMGFDGAPAPTVAAAGWVSGAPRQDGAGVVFPDDLPGQARSREAALGALSAGHIAFEDHVENGDNGWSFVGFRMWNRITRNYASATHSWWCGVDATHTYSTGERVQEWLISPPIDLSHWGGPTTLSFFEQYETEAGWDECRVDVSTDDGFTWEPLRTSAWGSSGGWKLTTLDMTAQAGKVVQVRFYFDTHDAFANNFPGWMVDDIVVTTSAQNWISVAPTSGTLPPGTGTVLHPVFDAGLLNGGLYSGSLRFMGDDPGHAPLQFPVSLIVVGVPNLVLSPPSVIVPSSFAGQSSIDTTLHVLNTGNDYLDISEVACSAGPFSTTLTAFQLAPGTSRAIPLQFAPSGPGDFNAFVSMHSNDPDRATASASISGRSQAPPVASLSPESLYVEVATGLSISRTVTLSNPGGTSLLWSASIRQAPGEPTPPTWIQISPTSGTIPAGNSTTLTATIVPTLIIAGSYRAIVHFTTNDPSRRDVDVPVEMFVPADAHLSANPLALEFGSLNVGQSKTMVLELASVGTSAIQVETIAASPGPFALIAEPGRLDPGQTLPIVVTFTASELGEARRTITIISSDPVRGVLKIPLHATATLPAQMTLAPGAFDVRVKSGLRETRLLTLGNIGGDALQSQITLETHDVSAMAPDPTTTASTTRGSKAAVRSASAGPGTRARGGPDVFGHEWMDSDEPGGPLYEWVELVGSGTPVALSGDNVVSPLLPIGFEFPFFEDRFSHLRVCTNGWISFTSAQPSFDPYPLPAIGAPENLIAIYWADLVASSGSVYYRQEPGRLIVEFSGLNPVAGGGPVSFEAILESSGQITMQYKTISTLNLRVVAGIQDARLKDGLTVVDGSNFLHNGMAVRITAPAPWVTVSPLSATVESGGQQDFEVTFDAVLRHEGEYFGHIQIVTNDPSHSIVNVPLHFAVDSDPDIEVAPLDFGDMIVGQSVSGTLIVRNVGTRAMHLYGADVGSDGLDITSGSLPTTILPGDSYPIGISLTALEPCDPCIGSINLYSDDPDENSISVEVRSRALLPPAIALSPVSLAVPLAPSLGAFAEHSTRTLIVTNTGGAPLHVSAVATVPWLAVSPASAIVAAHAHESFEVGFNGHGMSDGASVGAVRFTSDDPARPVASAPCTLRAGALAAVLEPRLARVNRAGEGRWVVSGITLPNGRDPRQLVASTLRLAGTPQDPARPAEYVGAEARFAFDRWAVLSTLTGGSAVPLQVTGQLTDSTWVLGSALVHVAPPVWITTPSSLNAAGDPAELAWSTSGDPAVSAHDLWYSADDGVNWRLITAGTEDASWIWTVPRPATTRGRIELVSRGATDEIGWAITDPFEVTGATTAAGNSRPLEFALRTYGRNPSSEALSVELAVPMPMDVRVDVFDLRGRQVRELAHREFAPGHAVLRWDGRNRAGHPAAAGVYFVHATAGTATRAVVRCVWLR